MNNQLDKSYLLHSAGWRLARCFQSKLTCLQRLSHDFVSEARGQGGNEIQTSPATFPEKNPMISYTPGPRRGPSTHRGPSGSTMRFSAFNIFTTAFHWGRLSFTS